MSTSKKVFVPNWSLHRANALLLEARFTMHYSSLSFRLLIPDADRRAIACAEAIRSVTHLVLAPDRESSFYLFSFLYL